MKLVHVKDLPEISSNHNPEIKKKVILDKNYIPKLLTFGQATFLPGQQTFTHTHESMYEVFYIQSGRVEFRVKGETDQMIVLW